MNEDACRLDVWLWRARFFKTRALAARFLEDGRVRLTRNGSAEVRVDKASRTVRPGDDLVFAIGGRLFAITVQGVGERDGLSKSEAHAFASDRIDGSGSVSN